MRAFRDAVQEQASAGLPELQQRVEQQTQQQPVQQQQSKTEPEDER
jgi:hypothetical protein